MAARDDEFADFVAARYRALLRTGLALTGDLGHAEDLAQSALIEDVPCLGSAARGHERGGLCWRTLVRLALRERQRRWRGEISAERLPEPDATTAAGQTGSDDLAIDIRRALATLPVEQRAVLVLRYLDDQSEAETAQLLGISPGTVKSGAARGLASLRHRRAAHHGRGPK